MALRTVGVRLAAEVSGYMNGMRTAATATRDFTREMDRAARAGKLDAVAHQATGMGLALGAAFGFAVNAAAQFDKQMSAVSAATHASAADMDKLREAAMQAGKDTSFSAVEAAKGIEELSKAGVSTADVLAGGLDGALALAAAGELDVGEAAETAASAMTQFKLSGKDVPHIADLLAAGAGKAQGSVQDMGAALNQAGLVSAQMGLSIEDTTGTLAAFASAGLIGSDAGTSLKTTLLMLANPTGKAADLMQELGIKAYDAQGKFVGISDLAGQLKSQLGKLTQEQRNSALATIFGSDAIRAASILYEQGADGIDKFRKAVDDQGYAAETASTKTDNLAGDIDRLKGSLETLAIDAGSGANGGLRMLVQAADGLVGIFSDLPGPVQTAITVIAGVGGASLLAVAGLIKVRNTASEAMDALRDIGPAGRTAANGIGAIGGIAGRLGLVGLGVMAIWEGMDAFSRWVDKKHAPVKANIDGLTKSIKEFADTGKVVGELADKYGSGLQKIGNDVAGITEGMKALDQTRKDVEAGLSDPSVGVGWDPVDPQAVQRVKDLDAALAKLVSEGGATQAKIFLDEMRGSGKLTGEQYGQLIGMLPQYTQATADASSANTGLAQGFGTTAANAQTMNGRLQDAIDKGMTLLDVWKQLNGATLSFDQSQLKVLDANKALAESFKKNGKEIEGNSRAAIENRVRVGEMAQQAADAAQKKYEETGSVAQASKVYNDYIGTMRDTLKAANLTDEQIAFLIATYAKIPEYEATEVSAPGAKTSKQLAAEVKAAMDKIPPEKKTSIYTKTADAKAAVEALRLKIAELVNNPHHVYISGTVYWTSKGDLKVPGGTIPKDRWGGVHEGGYTKAAQGVLRDAAMFGPRSPGRYMFAEPETGGELFAPKYGNLARTKAMVSHAIENWWGGWRNFVPSSAYAGGGSSGGSGAPNHYYFQPQQASVSLADFEAFQRRQDALTRLGRSR